MEVLKNVISENNLEVDNTWKYLLQYFVPVKKGLFS